MMTEILAMADRLADKGAYADTDDALNSVASADN